jgi:hypothetical protein
VTSSALGDQTGGPKRTYGKKCPDFPPLPPVLHMLTLLPNSTEGRGQRSLGDAETDSWGTEKRNLQSGMLPPQNVMITITKMIINRFSGA